MMFLRQLIMKFWCFTAYFGGISPPFFYKKCEGAFIRINMVYAKVDVLGTS